MKNSLSSNSDKDLQLVLKSIRKTVQEKKKTPVEEDGTGLLKVLGKIPFWCYNDTLHIDNPDYHNERCCLTHMVGLPKHPATKQEMPLTPYQIELFEAIMKEVTKPPNVDEIEWKRKHHPFHINKGRQMGFTEIILRIIQYFCFNRYAGSKVGIIAATNGNLARKDLRRFSRLFVKIKSVVEHGPKTTSEGTLMRLINDTPIYAFPASEEGMTGDTDYACVFMDESGKWKLVDDLPVFNSILPIVESNGSDLFLVSTPKGPMKMFYEITKDPKEYVMLEYPLTVSIGNLYTKEQVDAKLADSKVDVQQEYLCQFTTGRDSILGVITDEDRSIDVTEWGNEGIDEEDDGFVEDTDDTEPDWL